MIRVTFALFFGSALLSAQATDRSQPTITEAAALLAARTSSLLPRHGTVSLEFQNLTALSAGEWSSFRSQLQDELRKAGLETAGTQPEWRVRVTLSDDARGLLLVAEVLSGDNREIVILPWKFPSSVQAKPRVSFTQKSLWTGSDPILDVLLIDSGSQMLVLTIDKVASYRSVGGKWMPSAAASLLLSRALPRDPRGRLEATPDGFRAFLPAATCRGTFQPDLRLTCVNGTEIWPDTQARWVADRNTLEMDAMKLRFYSTAGGVFAMTDGRAQDRSGASIAGAEGWGSDIAGIADPCGGGTAVVASSANAEREEVHAFDVASGQATPKSDALPLSGPVTALWPAETPGEATLVVRNLQTGQYEASRLGVACTE